LYPLNRRQVGPQSQSGGFYHHHHHWLYSPGWALASSSKCYQQPLSWAATRQFLQHNFLTSSSTPSVHLEFGRPRPYWLPGFVHIILLGIHFHPFAQNGLPTSVYWILLC
jgi:hypothetical protein